MKEIVPKILLKILIHIINIQVYDKYVDSFKIAIIMLIYIVQLYLIKVYFRLSK